MRIREITDNPLTTKTQPLSKQAERHEVMTALSEGDIYGLYRDAVDAHERYMNNPNPASKVRLMDKLKMAQTHLHRIALILNASSDLPGMREMMSKINSLLAQIDDLLDRHYLEE